jgi:3-oxoadipate enol-lactonase
MPFVENLGARIFWDEQGSGAPLLLITGLGWPSGAWHRIRPILSKRYRTIAMDNRGAGQSDAGPMPYSITQMASDAVAVLNSARVNTAHIFGFAMGGMTAQEFSLQYPKKVRSLILGATSPGGPRAVHPGPGTIAILASRDSNPDKFHWALSPFIYAPETPRQRMQEDLDAIHGGIANGQTYSAQLQAITSWEGYSRIAQINAPTLVIHGQDDRMVPLENAKLIAARIPGAKLLPIPHAGHMFMTDQPEAAQAALLEFLDAQATRQSERASPVLES